MILCVFTVQNIQANSSDTFKDGIITGQIIDAALNEPLPYVNVIIKNTKQETVTGGITLDDGTFKITKINQRAG